MNRKRGNLKQERKEGEREMEPREEENGEEQEDKNINRHRRHIYIE